MWNYRQWASAIQSYVLPITSGWSLGSYWASLSNLLHKLDKLVLTHSQYRLIKLSNNPSGKNAILLSTSFLKNTDSLKEACFISWYFNSWYFQKTFVSSTLRLIFYGHSSEIVVAVKFFQTLPIGFLSYGNLKFSNKKGRLLTSLRSNGSL